jgi:tetratricopeptide (TPR) repeat protein
VLYYADEGRDARLQFELPLGSYTIEFRRSAGPDADGPARTAIAVHHLVNATGDASLNASIQGLSLELVSALTRLSGIRVVLDDTAPESGAALQARAQSLGVNAVMVGDVSAELKLALRLLDASDGSLWWTRQQPVALDRALDALEPLARSLVAEMQRSAERQQRPRIRLSGRTPLVRGAEESALREQMALARSAIQQGSLEACKKAVRLAEAAVAAAPEHAAAQALLADALISSVAITALPSVPTMETARAAAHRAIALDAECSAAHSDLGTIAFTFDRDWPAAEGHLLRALRYGPGEASSHARYGWSLMVSRRFAEARDAYAEARALDPLSLKYRLHEGLIAFYAREHALARRAFDAVLDIAPEHMIANALSAALHLGAGELQAGLVAYRAMMQRFPIVSVGRAGYAQALAMSGDVAAARRELRSLRERFSAAYLTPYQLAMVHARLGDDAAALACLADAASQHDFNYVCAGVDPAFDALHGNAAFRQLLQDSGLGVALKRSMHRDAGPAVGSE